VNAEGNIRDMF